MVPKLLFRFNGQCDTRQWQRFSPKVHVDFPPLHVNHIAEAAVRLLAEV